MPNKKWLTPKETEVVELIFDKVHAKVPTGSQEELENSEEYRRLRLLEDALEGYPDAVDKVRIMIFSDELTTGRL